MSGDEARHHAFGSIVQTLPVKPILRKIAPLVRNRCKDTCELPCAGSSHWPHLQLPRDRLLFRHAFGVWLIGATFERELIKERSADGIARAKAAGIKFGARPKLNAEQISGKRSISRCDWFGLTDQRCTGDATRRGWRHSRGAGLRCLQVFVSPEDL